MLVTSTSKPYQMKLMSLHGFSYGFSQVDFDKDISLLSKIEI